MIWRKMKLKERAEKSMGKTKDLDKKSDKVQKKFQRLVEDDDVIKMLEIILNNKDEIPIFKNAR